MFSRPKYTLGCPPREVNPPPTRIFPSGCTANEKTEELAEGAKPLSKVPSAFRRPRLLRPCPARLVKLPPTRILPSACSARQKTEPPTPGLKLASTVPSALSRPKFVRVIPARLVNAPPTKIFPSGCTPKQYTYGDDPLTPRLNAASSVPSAFSRPRRLRDCPPNVLKNPPTKTFPSGCTASA